MMTAFHDLNPVRMAMLATDEVRSHLRDYADSTDRPAWEAVEAADLLDKAAELLEQAQHVKEAA